jgi:tetratricopeptide (TPR) repeat protein
MLRALAIAVLTLTTQHAYGGTRLRPEHLELVRIVDVPERHVAPVPTPAGPALPHKGSVKELCTRAGELYISGKATEAAAVYKQALAIDRDYAPAHKGLGLVAQHMGFTAMAIDELRRYLALAPGAADVTSVRSRIERLGGNP